MYLERCLCENLWSHQALSGDVTLCQHTFQGKHVGSLLPRVHLWIAYQNQGQKGLKCWSNFANHFKIELRRHKCSDPFRVRQQPGQGVSCKGECLFGLEVNGFACAACWVLAQWGWWINPAAGIFGRTLAGVVLCPVQGSAFQNNTAHLTGAQRRATGSPTGLRNCLVWRCKDNRKTRIWDLHLTSGRKNKGNKTTKR